MIIAGKIITLLSALFLGWCLIGMIKMGSRKFDIYVGELLLTAWRKMIQKEENNDQGQ